MRCGGLFEVYCCKCVSHHTSLSIIYLQLLPASDFLYKSRCAEQIAWLYQIFPSPFALLQRFLCNALLSFSSPNSQSISKQFVLQWMLRIESCLNQSIGLKLNHFHEFTYNVEYLYLSMVLYYLRYLCMYLYLYWKQTLILSLALHPWLRAVKFVQTENKFCYFLFNQINIIPNFGNLLFLQWILYCCYIN